jgi:hypothetical protein
VVQYTVDLFPADYHGVAEPSPLRSTAGAAGAGYSPELSGWSIYQGRTQDISDYDPSLPPGALDYTQMVLFALVPSALLGLAAPLVKKPRSVRVYFAWAALVGGIGTYLGHQVLRLSHIGCGDQCVPAVPTYTAIGWVALAALVPAAGVPAVLGLAPWASGDPWLPVDE